MIPHPSPCDAGKSELQLKIEDWASIMQHTTEYIQKLEEELDGEEKLATQIVQAIAYIIIIHNYDP